jgi:hypothetical protein
MKRRVNREEKRGETKVEWRKRRFKKWKSA